MQQVIFNSYSDPVLKDIISSRFINRFFRTLNIIMLMCFMTEVANAASVTLEWDPTSQTIDGYRIFMRIEGQNYDYDNPTWQGKDTTCSMDGLEGGNVYYFVARAYRDTLESPDSNEVRHQPPVPTASAGDDQIVVANGPVTLDGSSSTNPDGGDLTYQWAQSNGPVVDIADSDMATASFTAPDVPIPMALLFELSIMDGNGLSSTDSCQVMVYPQGAVDSDNDGITDEDEIKIYRTDPDNPDTDGDGVSDGDELDAGTNPHGIDEIIIDNGGNGTSSTGNWHLSMGLSYYKSRSVYSRQAGATYTFEAPVTGAYDVALWWTYRHSRCSSVLVEIYDADQLFDIIYVNQLENDAQWNSLGTYNFTNTARIVILSKGDCSTNADAAKLTYNGTYEPPAPTADSGDDQIVIANGTVTLDGSGSTNPDGGDFTYQWIQNNGPVVDIADSDMATSNFTAPDVLTPTALLFELGIRDENGLSSTDTCQIMVYPQGVVDSDSDGITDEDEIIIHGTDPGNPDTDGDGVSDGEEINVGSDPTIPELIKIWFEAEDGDIYAPIKIADNLSASAGGYIEASSNNRRGYAQYTFDIQQPGDYIIWGRVISNSRASDSFLVSVDNRRNLTWHTKQGGKNIWAWDLVSKRQYSDPRDTSNPYIYYLTAGTHTLNIKQREKGTKIDQILITNDLNFVP